MVSCLTQRCGGQSVVFRTDCVEFEWEAESFSHWQALNSWRQWPGNARYLNYSWCQCDKENLVGATYNPVYIEKKGLFIGLCQHIYIYTHTYIWYWSWIFKVFKNLYSECFSVRFSFCLEETLNKTKQCHCFSLALMALWQDESSRSVIFDFSLPHMLSFRNIANSSVAEEKAFDCKFIFLKKCITSCET